MNIILWIVQGIAAALYLMAGSMKVFQLEKARESMGWTEGRSDGFVRFVGIMELLGAIGLILPLATGILPWLTVLAAIGLSIIQVLALFTEHLPKKEYNYIPVNIIIFALTVFIVYGRWDLFG